jgi:hypothetical protein
VQRGIPTFGSAGYTRVRGLRQPWPRGVPIASTGSASAGPRALIPRILWLWDR